MNLQIELRPLVKEGRGWLGEAECGRLVSAVFEHVRVPRKVRELSVVLVGPQRMETLAHRLKKRGPTDVLSFTHDPPLLGEIFLCPKVMKQRAPLFRRTPQEHARALFVHGLLHLLGYDHQRKRDAERMEEMEKKILGGESGEQVTHSSHPEPGRGIPRQTARSFDLAQDDTVGVT
jgi:probable rRNA maturation factor